mmetsp:Transcript_6293/g.15593  ORF Transcript_6293/g.15593 Transcript_6293/m.15593 type:complete len:241 (+) Transcript_6293:1169-1891(+)
MTSTMPVWTWRATLRPRRTTSVRATVTARGTCTRPPSCSRCLTPPSSADSPRASRSASRHGSSTTWCHSWLPGGMLACSSRAPRCAPACRGPPAACQTRFTSWTPRQAPRPTRASCSARARRTAACPSPCLTCQAWWAARAASAACPTAATARASQGSQLLPNLWASHLARRASSSPLPPPHSTQGSGTRVPPLATCSFTGTALAHHRLPALRSHHGMVRCGGSCIMKGVGGGSLACLRL